MKGILKDMYKIKKVYILGAGFSKGAGLPLTNQLLSLLHEQASYMEYDNSKWGQAGRILENLKYYYPREKFTHAKIASGKFNHINIEEFLSLVAAESFFLHPSDRMTEHGSYFISLCKKWLSEIILYHQEIGLKNIPDHYDKFVQSLDNSLILTFNWDTVIENLCEKNDKKYRYQLYEKNYDAITKSVPIIKLHGSIDWVSRRKKYDKDLSLEFKILGSQLMTMRKAIGNLYKFYEKYYYPWIVLPNFDKFSNLKKFGSMWEEPGRYLHDELEVIIIGYSLRPDDYHARSFIYPRLVRGSEWGELKVKVIDFATTKDQENDIKARFNGVKDCKFFFGGFNDKALDFINSW